MKLPTFVKNEKGFTILIGVLIVAAVSLAVALYLLTSGVNSYQNSYILEQSNLAKASANACAEVALNKIQMCSSTVGTGSVQINDQTCNYEIIKTGDSARTVQTSATFGDAVRKVKVMVNQVDPAITIESWQEVATF